MNELDIAIESAIKKGSTDIHIGRTARIRVDGRSFRSSGSPRPTRRPRRNKY